MGTGQGPNVPPDDWFDLLDDPVGPSSAPTRPAPLIPDEPAPRGRLSSPEVDPSAATTRRAPEDISRKITPVVLTPVSRPPSQPADDPDDDVWNWEMSPGPSSVQAPAMPPPPRTSTVSPPMRDTSPDGTFSEFDELDPGEAATAVPPVMPGPSGALTRQAITPVPRPFSPVGRTDADFDLDDAESWQFDPTAIPTPVIPPPSPRPGVPPSLMPPSGRPTAMLPPSSADAAQSAPRSPPPPGPHTRRTPTLGFLISARPTPLVPPDVPAMAMPTPLVPPEYNRAPRFLSEPPEPYAEPQRESHPPPPRGAPPRTPRPGTGQRPSIRVPPPPGVAAQPTSRTPSSTPSPRRDMHERFDLGDFTGALSIAEAMLAADPGDADARSVADVSRARLRAIYAGRLGSLHQVPVLVVPQSELRWLALDNRAGFVLSLVDGTSSLEEIIDVSAMSPLEVLRTLYNLMTQRVISLHPGRRP